MKKAWLYGGVILAIWYGCGQQKPASVEVPDDSFSFAFLTDIHLQPELGASYGFQWAIKEVNRRKPDFVLTGGDLIMDALNQSYGRVDSLYTLYQEMSEKFKMPVYNTMGNHEVYGWQRNEPGIEAHPEYGKKMFEKRLGKRYYSFDHKGWHFMVLDAVYLLEKGGYLGRIDEEQINWVRDQLHTVDPETPIVLSAHYPFITSASQVVRGSTVANPEGMVIINSREVLALFSEFNLRLVLQGHLHFLEDIFVQNQVHFITGGAVSGKWWNNNPESKPEEGFVMIHVDGKNLDWEYVDFGWTPPVEN
jgi:3',5'-cyclic AMP phosphodiesterase CpdA